MIKTCEQLDIARCIQGGTAATTSTAVWVEMHSAYLHQHPIHCESSFANIRKWHQNKLHYHSHRQLLKRILLIGCYVVYKHSQPILGFVTLRLLLLWSRLLYMSMGVFIITIRLLAATQYASTSREKWKYVFPKWESGMMS